MDTKKPTRGRGLYPIVLLALFVSISVVSQTVQQRLELTKDYNQEKLNTLVSQFEREFLSNKNELKKSFVEKQWGVSEKQQDGTVVAFNGLGTDGTPLFYTTYMEPTSKVSRANALHSYGDLELDLSGKGMTVGIWDAGVARTTHQEFDLRVKNNDGGEIDNHGTLVVGTVVSSGINEKAKGVAYDATALTYDWSRDKIEVAEAASNGLLVSNHSYGIKTDRVPDWYFGSYIKVSKDWDNIMYNAPYYLMVTASGNARNSYDNESPNFGKTQDGFDLLVGFTTAKNGLVIAGANTEFDGKGNLKSASVAGYSSHGPTDDGRIKPDLAGDGTLIHSTSSNSDTSYGSSMGTSMAAPGVTGSLLLLQEYHEELYGQFMKAATLKGLVLHAADDVEAPGPDYKMGWGVINTKKAAQILNQKDFSTQIIEETLQEKAVYSMTIKANGTESLSASISWTDPAGDFVNKGDLNSTVAAITNDLDIRITKNGDTYYPWKLNPAQASSYASQGDNLVDPFERIDIPAAQGEYTITISHKGNLVNNAQDFSLIVSGAKLTECQLVAPSELKIATSDDRGTLLEWTSLGMETLYEFQIRNENDSIWETDMIWEPIFSLRDLVIGETYAVRVRSVCSQNLVSDFSEEISFVYHAENTVLERNEVFSADNELEIIAYPNPAVNELRVEAELSEKAYYSVASTNGTILKSGRLKENIDVADLSTGLYVLTVQDYNGIKSTKFFKN